MNILYSPVERSNDTKPYMKARAKRARWISLCYEDRDLEGCVLHHHLAQRFDLNASRNSLKKPTNCESSLIVTGDSPPSRGLVGD
jgi:hypothetical protein